MIVASKDLWIGGPTDKIFPQHVPGYTGHVPAVKAENLFAKSFARITGKAKRLGTRRDVKKFEKERFFSQSSVEFTKGNFARLRKEPELLANKDYRDYAVFI